MSSSKKSNSAWNVFTVMLGISCFCGILYGLTYIFIDFHQPINGYSFRQTQTALSIYYLIQGGPIFAYHTPVLGAPWSIPMEFPLYQWLSALTGLLFDQPVDQAGRAVSIFFYVLSMPTIWALFRTWNFSRQSCMVPVALIAMSPVILFWSRSVMIESTAYSLGIMYLLCVSRYSKIEIRPLILLVLGAIIAMLCALTKITTFVPFCIFASGIVLLNWYKRFGFNINISIIRAYLPSLSFFALFPISVAYCWIKFSDYVKAQNPFARDFITSHNLFSWNFGTLEQRISISTWEEILKTHTTASIGSLSLLVVLIGSLFFIHKHRFLSIYSLISYCSAFVIFTNLYWVHNYYGMGNTVLLQICSALIICTYCEEQKSNKRFIGLFIFLLIMTSSYRTYKYHYYPQFQMDRISHQAIKPLGQAIQDVTLPNEVVLIYGNDWNPAIPYSAKRRALMDRWDLPLKSKKFMEAVDAIGKENIRTMVVCGKSRLDVSAIKNRTAFFNLNPSFKSVNTCNIYKSANLDD